MNTYRTVLEADLTPLAGALFQPAGFPDLGAAEFGDHALLVESAQSMANWLEAATWNEAQSDQVAELATLPYVRVVSPEGHFLSSSRLEAHRLASAALRRFGYRSDDLVCLPGAAVIIRFKKLV